MSFMAWPMLFGETETQLSLALFLVLSPVEEQQKFDYVSFVWQKYALLVSHSFILGAS